MNEKIELQLQRLADGELDRRQLRTMLQQAQRQPELWQAMALAFVENQILQQEIAGGQFRHATNADRSSSRPDVATSNVGPSTVATSKSAIKSDSAFAAAIYRGQEIPKEEIVHAQLSVPHRRSLSNNPSWRWWSALAATWLVIPMAYWMGTFGNSNAAFQNMGTEVAQSNRGFGDNRWDASGFQDERQSAVAEVAGHLDGTRDGNPVLENPRLPSNSQTEPRTKLPNNARTLASNTLDPNEAPFSVKLVGQDGADLADGPIPLYPASMATQAGVDPSSATVPIEVQRRYNQLGFEVRVQVTQIQLQLDDGREISLPIRNYVLIPIGQ